MTGKASGIAAIQIVFLSMVRDKVVLKKAGLDFWKVGVEWNPIDFHSHVHKKHMSNLGRR